MQLPCHSVADKGLPVDATALLHPLSRLEGHRLFLSLHCKGGSTSNMVEVVLGSNLRVKMLHTFHTITSSRVGCRRT